MNRTKDARVAKGKPFLEGKAAGDRGEEFSSPYRYGTRANVQWCQGYLGREQ